jgi:hypothetical protein
MDRQQAIAEIKQLYPPGESETGNNLLAEAKHRCNTWESEPDAVIFQLLQLNRDYESKQMQKYRGRTGA